MIKDYFSLALNGIRRRRLRSWLTMIGIFIGIAAVVALIGLGEGLRVAISSQFGFLGTDMLSVQAQGMGFSGPPGTGTAKPLTDDLAEKIEKINNVEAVFNRYIASTKFDFNDRQRFAYIMSSVEGPERKIFEKTTNLEVLSGRLLKDGDNRKVVIGFNYGDSDEDFGRTIKVGDKISLNDKNFEVVGILKKKGSFIYDNIIMMNEHVVLEEFKEEGDNSVNVIAVKVFDPDRIPQTQEDIEKLLRKERDVKLGEEDFTVETPQKSLENLNSTLFAVQLFVYIIASISLLVGGIGIMNTMYTSILERTKEIGVMKSIGARRSAIFSIFFIESGLLGLVGGLIGIGLGMFFAYGMAFIGKIALGSELIQASISIWLILGALAFSFILGILFGTLPAIKAAKMMPVDSLRSAK